MNSMARKIIMDRMRDSRRDYEDGRGYDSAQDPGRARDYANEQMPNYAFDGRQGVKGTGPYGIGGRLYDRRMDDGTYDYRMNDPRIVDRARGYDMASESSFRLKPRDMKEWKRDLENPDGTMGEHFRDMDAIMKTAEQMGLSFRGYDEKDLCMTVNALYSDYSKTLKSFVQGSNELPVYVSLAKDFLEDRDASAKGAEKLALYYHLIVKDDE